LDTAWISTTATKATSRIKSMPARRIVPSGGVTGEASIAVAMADPFPLKPRIDRRPDRPDTVSARSGRGDAEHRQQIGGKG
jgi:hypothetical protein